MDASPQFFHVKWNEHHSDLPSSFYKSFKLKRFTDMAFLCQGQILKCHKVVVCAVSAYAERQLEQHSSGSPVLCLESIPFAALEKLLEIIYTGEVHLKGGEMQSFFQAAQKLEVQNFFDWNDEPNVPIPPATNVRGASSRKRTMQKSWRNEDMASAIESVRTRRQCAAVAARFYKIPIRTLYYRLVKLGIPTRLPGQMKYESDSLTTSSVVESTTLVSGQSAPDPTASAVEHQYNEGDDDDVMFLGEFSPGS